MGIVEGDNGFGLEGAGIVNRTGPNVKGLQPGDRVLFIAHDSFATHVVMSENLCEKIPDNLTFEDAATIPCVFATSYHSIFNMGNLKKGQVCRIDAPVNMVLITIVYTNPQRLWWCWYRYYPVGPEGRREDLCHGQQRRKDQVSRR